MIRLKSGGMAAWGEGLIHNHQREAKFWERTKSIFFQWIPKRYIKGRPLLDIHSKPLLRLYILENFLAAKEDIESCLDRGANNRATWRLWKCKKNLGAITETIIIKSHKVKGTGHQI